MSTIQKVVITYDDKELEATGAEAQKWERNFNQISEFASSHNFNSFESNPVKWGNESLLKEEFKVSLPVEVEELLKEDAKTVQTPVETLPDSTEDQRGSFDSNLINDQKASESESEVIKGEGTMLPTENKPAEKTKKSR